MKFLLVFVLTTLCGLAQAEFITGAQLLQLLNLPGEVPQNQALGYIVGVHDANKAEGGYCTPDDLTGNGLRDEVKAALPQAGALLNVGPANIFVIAYLKTAYPCADEKAPSKAPAPAAAPKRGKLEA